MIYLFLNGLIGNKNKIKEINKIKIKYGENPNQKAYYLPNSKRKSFYIST